MLISEKNYSLLFLCVLYGDTDHILKLFDSFCRQKFDFENYHVAIVIINNNESSLLPDAVKNYKFPSGVDFIILHPSQNLGYFGAAQWALKQFNPAAWTIVSNSDLIINDELFLEKLKSLKINVRTAVVAPEIISEISGLDQNPYLITRPKALKMKILKLIFSIDAVSFMYQSLAYFKNSIGPRVQVNNHQIDKIYAPHGSFIIFHRKYFESGLDFAHPPFLFGEEITVAENLRRSQLSAVYEPSLKIKHEEHQATGRIPNRKMRKFIAKASRYCADQFFQTKD